MNDNFDTQYCDYSVEAAAETITNGLENIQDNFSENSSSQINNHNDSCTLLLINNCNNYHYGHNNSKYKTKLTSDKDRYVGYKIGMVILSLLIGIIASN